MIASTLINSQSHESKKNHNNRGIFFVTQDYKKIQSKPAGNFPIPLVLYSAGKAS